MNFRQITHLLYFSRSDRYDLNTRENIMQKLCLMLMLGMFALAGCYAALKPWIKEKYLAEKYKEP